MRQGPQPARLPNITNNKWMWCHNTSPLKVVSSVSAQIPNSAAAEPHGRPSPDEEFLAPPVSFSVLPVLPRKPTPRSSKSIAAHSGQMTSRLVRRSTLFHHMWSGLLNWRKGLREKIFPCTKSNLAAGGRWSCEWAAPPLENALFFSDQMTPLHLPLV